MKSLAITFSPGAAYRGFLLLLLAVVGGLLTQESWKAYDATRSALNQDRTRSVRLASTTAAYQATWLDHTAQLLRVLGGISLGQRASAPACSAFLARQLDGFNDYDNLAFAAADGRVWCSAQAWPDALRVPVVQEGMQFLAIGRHSVGIAVPHHASDGHIDGAVLATFNSRKLFPQTAGALPADSDFALFDGHGKLLAAYPNLAPWESLDPLLAQGLHELDSGSVLRHADNDGATRFYALAPVSGLSKTLWLVARAPMNVSLRFGPVSLLLILGVVILALSLWHLSRIFALHVHGQLAGPARVWRYLRERTYLRWRYIRRSARRLLTRHEDTQALQLALLQKDDRVRQLLQLDELSQTLQNCSHAAAWADAVVRCTRSLFPGSHGALFVSLGEKLERVRHWGEGATVQALSAQDCPAVQLARDAACGAGDGCCAHGQTLGTHICLPLIAQQELQGILQLGGLNNTGEEIIPWAASSIAQRAANALALLRRQEQLQRRAIRDALTGLFNRGFMEEALSIEQQRAARRGLPVGVLMLDVDHFKQFNDHFGHDAGDVLLRGLGAILRRTVREGDMACRFGGEEFVVIMPGADLSGTRQRAEVLRAAIERWQPEHQERSLKSVTVSIGVAAFPLHGDTWQAVLKVADQALYRAKDAGRNRVVAAPIAHFPEHSRDGHPEYHHAHHTERESV